MKTVLISIIVSIFILCGIVLSENTSSIVCQDSNIKPETRTFLLKEEILTPQDWWNDDWNYRRPVQIDNTSYSSEDLTDYQILVDVTYDGDMKTDFSDLRFIYDDDTTILSYWVEEYTPSSDASVWVEVPFIAEMSTKTIYMYYGNSSATSESDIHDTFVFGDDFESSSWTNSHWSVQRGTWEVTTSGYYRGYQLTTPSDGYCLTTGFSLSDYIVESKIRHVEWVNSCVSILGRGTTTEINTYYECEIDESDLEIYRFDGPSPDYTSIANGWDGNPPQLDEWFHIQLTLSEDYLEGYCYDRDVLIYVNDSNYNYAGPAGVMVHNQYGEFDDFRVRKYTFAPPIITVGEEETNAISSTSIGSIKAMFE
jgi:hypothetical protein